MSKIIKMNNTNSRQFFLWVLVWAIVVGSALVAGAQTDTQCGDTGLTQEQTILYNTGQSRALFDKCDITGCETPRAGHISGLCKDHRGGSESAPNCLCDSFIPSTTIWCAPTRTGGNHYCTRITASGKVSKEALKFYTKRPPFQDHCDDPANLCTHEDNGRPFYWRQTKTGTTAGKWSIVYK